MAVTNMWRVVEPMTDDAIIEYIELEHFDLDTKLEVKSYGPSYGGLYSSFTYVSEDNLSLIIHEYFAATGLLSFDTHHIDSEEKPGMKFINGQSTFKSVT
jgi:hypothetical protein